MLKICLEDGTLPTEESIAAEEVARELALLDDYLVDLGDQPASMFEKAVVRTYLMAKLNGQIPNVGR